MKLYATSALASLAFLAAACGASTDSVSEAHAAAPETPAATAEVTAAPVDNAAEAAEAAAILAEVASATYDLEKTHAFLFASVKHAGGLSDYTMKFKDWDATLDFNAEDVTQSSVSVSINPVSVETDHPSKPDWNTEIHSDVFKSADFPQITFASTAIETTGAMTGTMTGDLTFLGVTKPVTLDVTFNGVANMPWSADQDTIGFTAKGSFNRTDFGADNFLQFGISDETKIYFSGEFLQRPAE